MRLVLLIKSTLLLLLLNGAAVSCAQAASLAYEFDRVGSVAYRADSLQGVPFGVQTASASLPGPGPGPSAMGFLADFSGDSTIQNIEGSFAGRWVLREGFKAADESVGFLGRWANAGSFDGLIAGLADGQFRIGLHGQGIGLVAQSASYINQPTPVPLPAAAWLFASALFGFIVVASRRKV